MVEMTSRGDSLPWLLEPANPSARYLTLRHVLGRSEDDPDVVAARAGILEAEPAAGILAAQWPDGYWVTPDRGYTPRYRATVWQIMFLAQLGAARDERIERACEFVWSHSRREDGTFTPHQDPELDDLVNLNGNLLRALVHFGYAGDPRVREVLEGLGGLALQSLVDAGHTDAVVKLCRGLLALPPALLSELLSGFLDDASGFLLRRLTHQIDESRLNFGFPLAEETDLLEMLYVAGRMGAGGDPRAASGVEIVASKQDQNGRWKLDTLPGKMWASFGELGQPNKWVTLRALRVLRVYAPRGSSSV